MFNNKRRERKEWIQFEYLLVIGIVVLVYFLYKGSENLTKVNPFVVIQTYDATGKEIKDFDMSFSVIDKAQGVQYIKIIVNGKNIGDTNLDMSILKATFNDNPIQFNKTDANLKIGEQGVIAESNKIDITPYQGTTQRLILDVEGSYTFAGISQQFTKSAQADLSFGNNSFFIGKENITEEPIIAVCQGIVCKSSHCGYVLGEKTTSYYDLLGCNSTSAACMYNESVRSDKCSAIVNFSKSNNYPKLQSEFGYAYWKNAYDTVMYNTYNGQGFRHWGGPVAWSWDHVDYIESQIIMFENTGDITYLDLAYNNLEDLKQYLTDCKDPSKAAEFAYNGNGDGFLDWRCAKAGSKDGYLDNGRMWYPYIRFAYAVNENAVSKYLDVGKEYQNLVTTQWLDGDLKAMKNISKGWFLYEVNGEKRGFINAGNGPDGKPSACNHNRCEAIYATYLYSYLLTGNEEYRDLFERWGNFFKAVLVVRQDTQYFDKYYFWHYHDDDPQTTLDHDSCQEGSCNQNGICESTLGETDQNCGDCTWMCNGPAETFGYANWDLNSIMVFFEHGFVFSKEDIKLFANTYFKAAAVPGCDVYDPNNLTKILYKNVTLIGEFVQPPSVKDWTNVFRGTGSTQNAVRLAYYDPGLFNIMEDIEYMHYTYMNTQAKDKYWRPTTFSCVDDPRDGYGNPVCPESGFDTSPSHIMMGIANIMRFN